MNTASDRLAITSIVIENYRQYYGEQEIIIKPDNKFINTILGENGAGKSNILNAINYCLYLTEPHLKGKSQKMPIINTKAVNDAKKGELIRMKVEMIIEGKNMKYKISRIVQAIKHELIKEEINGEEVYKVGQVENIGMFQVGVNPGLQSSFLIARKGERGWVEKPIETMVQQLLPPELGPFFFLDGEFLESLHSTFGNIKKGVEELSHLSITFETIKHLEQVIRHLEKRTTGINRDADEQLAIKTSTDQWLKSINSLGDIEAAENYENMRMSELPDTKYHPKSGRPRLETKKQDRDFVKAKIKEVDDELLKLQAANVREWTKTLQRLESDIPRKQEKLDGLQMRKMNSLIRTTPFVYIQSAVDYTIKLVDEKREKGELPVKYADVFVNDLKEKGSCICGSVLDPEKLKIIENWKTKSQLSEKLDTAVEAVADFKIKKRNLNFDLSNIDDKRKEISDLLDEIERLDDEVAELKTKLKDSPEKTVAELYEQREAREKQLEDLDREMGGLDTEIIFAESQKNNADSEYNRILKSHNKLQKDQKKIALFQRALNNLQTVRDIVLMRVRDVVQNKTKENFFNLIWKKEAFKNVTLSGDYRLSVVNHHGYDVTQNLSAGEKLVLALSFISAIRQISAIKMPLIIDTPLGKISGKPTKNVADFLPKYFENTQVTLLVTDKEYRFIDPAINSTFRELLKDNVNKEYELFFDETSGTTQIGQMKERKNR